ncbi:helix-turn-helix domain-containing protein [Photobacterium halotolerans]|uniref:ArsR/SmtB family transcription factor n=1 Tax=Photobacterium halotolerans TaxID=265726 RepID=UPI00137252C6|nr:helix-turn-helix domain-containing protein [Photobacterium halotolerans]NAX48281.1 helix-turn-helix domain-containing protein [Photobacterium halotolerans]
MKNLETKMRQSGEELLDLLKALAHPIRLKIIVDLINDEVDAERHCSSFGLTVTKATRSHHFKILKDSGLIAHVDRGNRSFARLRRVELEALYPGLLSLLKNNYQQCINLSS